MQIHKFMSELSLLDVYISVHDNLAWNAKLLLERHRMKFSYFNLLFKQKCHNKRQSIFKNPRICTYQHVRFKTQVVF